MRLIMVVLSFFTFASSANAIPLGSFSCVTNNDPGDCAIGGTALSGALVAVTPITSELSITMTGTDAAVVEEVLLESVVGLTSLSIVSSGSQSTFGAVSPGVVEFGFNNPSGNLPGGNQPGVNFMEAFVSVVAEPPAPLNGVGYHDQDPVSGQTVYVTLDHTGFTFDELFGGLRVGVHVIGFESGGSESFVTNGIIPEPGTALLLGAGLVGLGTRRRVR